MPAAHDWEEATGIADDVRGWLLSAPPTLEMDAAAMAADVSNQITRQLNDGVTPVAVSLLTRVLLARALIGIAASWSAELTRAPEPEAYRAMVPIVLNPPARLSGEIINVDDDDPRIQGAG